MKLSNVWCLRLAAFTAVGVLVAAIHLAAGEKAPKGADAGLAEEVGKIRKELASLRAEVLNDRALNQVRGLWDETWFVKAGVKGREADPVSWRLETEVPSDRLVLAAEVNGGDMGVIAVDATKSPMWVTFRRVRPDTAEVVIYPGIARCEHKQLTLALPAKPVSEARAAGDYKERPTGFESTRANGVEVYKLVRPDYRRTGR